MANLEIKILKCCEVWNTSCRAKMGFLTIDCLTEWGTEERRDWQSTLNKQDGDLVNQTNIKTTACEKKKSQHHKRGGRRKQEQASLCALDPSELTPWSSFHSWSRPWVWCLSALLTHPCRGQQAQLQHQQHNQSLTLLTAVRLSLWSLRTLASPW